MRSQNLATILRTVQLHGPLARVGIVRLTGISSGTVTKLSAQLVEAGVLTELPSASSGPIAGRPRVPLDLNAPGRAALTVHVGLTQSTAGLVDVRGNVITETVVRHTTTTPEHVLRTAVNSLRDLAEQADRQIVGLGVSTGGTIDHRTGVLIDHPALHWRDVAVRDTFADGLGLPVEYDDVVRGVALAELTYGPGRGEEHMLNLFVGNVVGSALAVRGEVHRGETGSAGQVTHLPLHGIAGPMCECGHTNCFQAVASNVGLLEIGRAEGVAAPDETFDQLLARAEEPGVRRLLDRRAEWVGQAVAVLCDLLDPSAVVLSGNATHAPGYLAAIEATTTRLASRGAETAGRLRLFSFAKHLLSVSTAAIFLDRYFRDPVAYEPALERAHEDHTG